MSSNKKKGSAKLAIILGVIFMVTTTVSALSSLLYSNNKTDMIEATVVSSEIIDWNVSSLSGSTNGVNYLHEMELTYMYDGETYFSKALMSLKEEYIPKDKIFYITVDEDDPTHITSVNDVKGSEIVLLIFALAVDGVSAYFIYLGIKDIKEEKKRSQEIDKNFRYSNPR